MKSNVQPWAKVIQLLFLDYLLWKVISWLLSRTVITIMISVVNVVWVCSGKENANGKMQLHMIWCVWRIPEERTKSGCGNWSQGRLQQSPVQAADGPVHAIYNIESSWYWPNGLQECSWREKWLCSLETGVLLLVSTQWANHKDHPSCQFLTKGLADLSQSGPSKVLALSGDGLTNKTSRDIQEAAKAVQHHLDNISHWCQNTGSVLSPNKAQTVWYKMIPAVTSDGAVAEQAKTTDSMWKQLHSGAKEACQSWRLWLHFHKQYQHFQVYHSVVLTVISYGQLHNSITDKSAKDG